MTFKVELLPLPRPSFDYPYAYDGDDMKNYAHANVGHTTARLRAELVKLRNKRADAVRACALANNRVAELEKTLREWWLAHRPVGWTEDQHRACPYVNLATATDKALVDALLRGHDQEGRDD